MISMQQSMPEPLLRISEFEKLGFGLFIHWGLYSQLENGEWVRKAPTEISKEQYAKLMNTFNASDYDAKAIVNLAKEAGMKYVCLTTRHHEGFSLYDTRGLNTFDAPHSPAGRDLVKEYADACHELDMKMFFYHTTIDWHEESFKNDWDAYLSYLKDSVELLCKHYGSVAGFWFDGNWAVKDKDWRESELYGMIRSYHPDCIIVNNTSIGAGGQHGHPEIDTLTFEQGKPAKQNRIGMSKYLASEMCETINSYWGIATNDFSYKSPAEIIKTLLVCRKNGANLLLNVGPTGSGRVPDYEKALLKIVGKWIRLCGESLYEGKPAELVCKGEDFILESGGAYYYYLCNLPCDGQTHLPMHGESGAGLKTVQGQLPPVTRMTWVDNGEELTFMQDLPSNSLFFHVKNNTYGRQPVVRVVQITIDERE